jgi:hypothetical protein
MSKLKEGKVNLVRMKRAMEINGNGILVETADGEEKLVEADTVILADMRSVDDLKDAKPAVFTIGDALITRRGNSAILDGYKMGMRL